VGYYNDAYGHNSWRPRLFTCGIGDAKRSFKDLMGRVLLLLVLAQFIIVIDTTFMNVSISTLVRDLHTTVTGVQSAIALYALTMAALMIAGAKFGDIIGRKRAFIAGLCVYGVGTTITSLASSLPVFIVGWSVLEGAGAALMLPAMMSLIIDNFPAGPERTKAYAAFAATAGIAAAIGPVVGGLFTTYLSWRLAFASELLVVVFVLLQRRFVQEQPLQGPKPRFDWLGFGLSALGLITVVQGIILASTYGIVRARTDFAVGGHVLLPAGGVSPTIVFVAVGLVILGIFWLVEQRRSKKQLDTLLRVDLLKTRAVSAGSLTQLMQALVLTGAIFALSLYVQMELAYNAIESGLTLLPLSVGLVFAARIAGRRLARSHPPRSIIIVGFLSIVCSAFVMGLTARMATSGADFLIGLLLIGIGVGFVVSQNQNLIMSSVSTAYTNETSGVVNTFQNIGASLGTALSGAVVLAVFVSVATGLVASSSAFTPSQQSQVTQAITTKAQIVSNQQLETLTATLPAGQQQAVLQINAEARERALTLVYFALGTVGLLGIVFAWRLPKTPPLATVSTPL
jgi:MFS family permease